ncbi:HAD-IA family hydrolase [Lactovum miscens]|uniref:HAD superfamily hydrolase (TIGR01549 family) n=1 Tax=Lactovum miscens TaxID=190387 RepID=A0A841BZY1_9LACT|nr:HAD-IA family hydrolase [Lactovum miscens]MBB5887186.1 HAD superfamily hydrolase (TIGR01549 family) [Lactovum miscens]
MTYKNYIWDLGGTLLDNYEVSTRAFIAVLFRHGFIRLHHEIYPALKVSTGHAVEKFAKEIPGFLSEYKKLEAESLEKPILFDGGKDVLAKVIESGGQNFMISHRNRQVLSILESSGIKFYFTEVVTSENGFPRKPQPNSINYLLEKYQLEKADTLVIGDREIDIDAGHSAGCSTVFFDSSAVNDKATYSVKSLREILKLK